jgi:hypothetical protein
MAATLLGFTGLALGAQTPEPQFDSSWETATTARAGSGYKDNVFLAHDDRVGAAFLSGAGEFIAARLPFSGPEVTVLADGEAQHYFTGDDGHREYSAFLSADATQTLTSSLSTTLSAFYLFQDQVIDVSTSEDIRQALQAVGHFVNFRPSLRLELPRRHWISLEAIGARQFFESPLDDYWETGAKLVFGRSYAERSSVTLSYEPAWRYYDEDVALDHEGTPIPGSTRERWRNDVRLSWRHFWDEALRWRTTAAVGWQLTEENGGYFNYTRWLASVQVEYHQANWRIAADARLNDYSYEHQEVSPTDPELRHRTDVSLGARVERKLTEQLKAVLSYAYERTLSNDSLETYYVTQPAALWSGNSDAWLHGQIAARSRRTMAMTIALVLMVLAAVILLTTWQLRRGIREQIAGRDAEVFYAIATLHYADEIKQYADEIKQGLAAQEVDDPLSIVLRTALTRGVLGVRIYYPSGQLRARFPSLLLKDSSPPAALN